ncbi:hypothetical protein B296_00030772 [Ensete ventricosum]|uniref:Retrotransposon gag domain-containing protein n=1 Tax=Ensete ventricosum TaxID=4639 RepID=A0A426ZSQ2_ENSVE|nr:hypothetical protein B296_00030772 [Ensete ventricosum]
MSQDRISNLIPSRMTEEAAPPTPAPATMPQIAVAPSAPQPGVIDGGQSTLTPDRYWRLFTNPGLTPLVHSSQLVTTEAFLRLAHQLRRVNERLGEVPKEVTKSKEETAESSRHKSPFAPEIRDKPILANFRLPVLESYDGSSDPTEHVAAFRVQMALYDSSDVMMCRVFPTTLRGPARMWHDRLQPTTIISFDQLARELEQNFHVNARPNPMITSLLSIAQGREEPLTQFINRFTTESWAIPDAHPSLVIQAFLMGIRSSKLFWSLVEKPPTTVLEIMQRANYFIAAVALIVEK